MRGERVEFETGKQIESASKSATYSKYKLGLGQQDKLEYRSKPQQQSNSGLQKNAERDSLVLVYAAHLEVTATYTRMYSSTAAAVSGVIMLS